MLLSQSGIHSVHRRDLFPPLLAGATDRAHRGAPGRAVPGPDQLPDPRKRPPRGAHHADGACVAGPLPTYRYNT